MQESRKWYVQSEDAHIAADPPSIVDGPHVRWRSWNGKTGVLPPTTAPAK